MARGTEAETGQLTVLVKWRGLDYDKASWLQLQVGCIAWLPFLCRLCTALAGKFAAQQLVAPGLNCLCINLLQATWEPAVDMEAEKGALQQVSRHSAACAVVTNTCGVGQARLHLGL